MVKDSDRPIGDFNDHWDEIIKYIPLNLHPSLVRIMKRYLKALALAKRT